MIRYNSCKQLTIEEFKTPFELKLDKNNRWVKLSQKIPWDDLASIYYKNMSKNEGRPSIDARIIIGAIIVKHKMKFSDQETILQIQENPYLQYFLGLQEYRTDWVFAPSLFVDIRKRLGIDKFNDMTDSLIDKAFPEEKKTEQSKNKRKNNYKQKSTGNSNNTNDNINNDNINNNEEQNNSLNDPSNKPESKENTENTENTEISEGTAAIKHKGKLILDATAVNQAIKYPTDLDLLNESREITEELIDKFWELGLYPRKPRSYRRIARKDYLAAAKKRKKSKKVIRNANGKQLNYLKRNLSHIDEALESAAGRPFLLSSKEQKKLLIVREVYRQQREMHSKGVNRCEDRIVSISQPYIRPIVRGKVDTPVEFGPKFTVILQNGFAKIDRFSWDAYNESEDLIPAVEKYYKQKGYYPESVNADTIFGTQSNRKYLQLKGIKYIGKALGRPRKVTAENKKELASEKRKRQQEYRERIPIEGKFGQGKNGYDLGYLRARTSKTSGSWIGAIFFVMNIINMEKLMLKKINSLQNVIKIAIKRYFSINIYNNILINQYY